MLRCYNCEHEQENSEFGECSECGYEELYEVGTRKRVSLLTDITIVIPKELKVKDRERFIRESFIDFLQSAEFIELSFDEIDED